MNGSIFNSETQPISCFHKRYLFSPFIIPFPFGKLINDLTFAIQDKVGIETFSGFTRKSFDQAGFPVQEQFDKSIIA